MDIAVISEKCCSLCLKNLKSTIGKKNSCALQKSIKEKKNVKYITKVTIRTHTIKGQFKVPQKKNVKNITKVTIRTHTIKGQFKVPQRTLTGTRKEGAETNTKYLHQNHQKLKHNQCELT